MEKIKVKDVEDVKKEIEKISKFVEMKIKTIKEIIYSNAYQDTSDIEEVLKDALDGNLGFGGIYTSSGEGVKHLEGSVHLSDEKGLFEEIFSEPKVTKIEAKSGERGRTENDYRTNSACFFVYDKSGEIRAFKTWEGSYTSFDKASYYLLNESGKIKYSCHRDWDNYLGEYHTDCMCSENGELIAKIDEDYPHEQYDEDGNQIVTKKISFLDEKTGELQEGKKCSELSDDEIKFLAWSFLSGFQRKIDGMNFSWVQLSDENNFEYESDFNIISEYVKIKGDASIDIYELDKIANNIRKLREEYLKSGSQPDEHIEKSLVKASMIPQIKITEELKNDKESLTSAVVSNMEKLFEFYAYTPNKLFIEIFENMVPEEILYDEEIVMACIDRIGLPATDTYRSLLTRDGDWRAICVGSK